MTKRLLFSLTVAMLFGIAQPVSGQIQPKQKAELDIRPVVPLINVVVDVHTFEEPLFVPSCGELEGAVVLCVGTAAHLEVETKQGWHPVKSRTTYGTLGVAALDRVGGRLIASRNKAYFYFLFSRRFFEVEPGQRLRVVVDTWSDEQSMRTGTRPIQLTSPPFECPQSGLGL